MKVRPFRPEDELALREIYEAMGLDYTFPDLLSPEFVDIQVLEDEGVPVMAIASRKTVETYLLMDRHWKTPGWRSEAFMQLHLAAHRAVKALGFSDAHCWVPPEVEKAFGRRLTRIFGWKKSIWSVFSKEL